MKNKGQMAIIGILMVLITLIIFAVLAPQMIDVINNLTAQTDDLSDWFLKLIPLTIALAIFFSVLWYARPIGERE